MKRNDVIQAFQQHDIKHVAEIAPFFVKNDKLNLKAVKRVNTDLLQKLLTQVNDVKHKNVVVRSEENDVQETIEVISSAKTIIRYEKGHKYTILNDKHNLILQIGAYNTVIGSLRSTIDKNHENILLKKDSSELLTKTEFTKINKTMEFLNEILQEMIIEKRRDVIEKYKKNSKIKIKPKLDLVITNDLSVSGIKRSVRQKGNLK